MSATSIRASLAEQAQAIFSPDEQPLVDTPKLIQYDYIAVESQGPVTLAFGCDGKARLTSLTIDAVSKEQNPVAQALAAWLEKPAGPGSKIENGLAWAPVGFTFTLADAPDAGEDSIYGLVMLRK